MSPLDVPFALALIAVGLFPVVAAVVRSARRARGLEAPQQPPASSAAGHVAHPRCHVTGCTFPGRVPVHQAGAQGWRVLHVCQGCADEGAAFGWWHRAEVAA